MADRIVVLNRGIVEQIGSPEDLYQRPANRFVARFMGTPSMSLVRGKVSGGRFESGALSSPLDVRDGDVVLGVRPEDVRVEREGTPATVRAIEPVGETGYLYLEIEGMRADGGETSTSEGPTSEGEVGRKALLSASVPGPEAFKLREGAQVHVALRSERCHAFDPDSGVALPRRGP